MKSSIKLATTILVPDAGGRSAQPFLRLDEFAQRFLLLGRCPRCIAAAGRSPFNSRLHLAS